MDSLDALCSVDHYALMMVDITDDIVARDWFTAICHNIFNLIEITVEKLKFGIFT